MAVRNPEAVQQLSGSAVRTESRPSRIGPISLGAKQTGERSAGNPHAAFDDAGRICEDRRFEVLRGKAVSNRQGKEIDHFIGMRPDQMSAKNSASALLHQRL